MAVAAAAAERGGAPWKENGNRSPSPKPNPNKNGNCTSFFAFYPTLSGLFYPFFERVLLEEIEFKKTIHMTEVLLDWL